MRSDNLDCITVTAFYDGAKHTINAARGSNLLDALQNAGIYLPAICGGKGTCGKCAVLLKSGTLKITDSDKRHFSEDELNEGRRLSCVALPESDITIEITANKEEEFSALTFYSEADSPLKTDNNTQNKNGGFFSIAVDIGTTTIAFALVDMDKRQVCGNLTVVNKQRKYGADVISRILNATDGKLMEMSETVKIQISESIKALCEQNSVDLKTVTDICISANTTMIHLLLGLSCETLGAYPFTPVTLEHMIKDYDETLYGGLNAKVHILPGISTYVGADVTAGIYFTELNKKTKPSLLLDIGTNGEMAVCTDGNVYCTATAAGPAFEGGNISFGTGSVLGAISSAKYNNGQFECETIGGKPPIGICGSGVIDIVYECLKNGLIDKTGRFKKQFGSNGVTVSHTADGREIKFSQKDIRELQLGKSAIRSGIDVLLAFAELTYDDIDALYIAGGFGFKINFQCGTALGLIPAEFINKIHLVGNSSLGGSVKYLLSKNGADELAEIVSVSKEHNLPQDKLFNKLFIENMSF